MSSEEFAAEVEYGLGRRYLTDETAVDVVVAGCAAFPSFLGAKRFDGLAVESNCTMLVVLFPLFAARFAVHADSTSLGTTLGLHFIQMPCHTSSLLQATLLIRIETLWV